MIISKTKKSNNTIPKHELESLARVLLPSIREFFNSEEGRREFEEWKKQKEQVSADIG